MELLRFKIEDIMYLRPLKAARSAKIFWEEIFMPKSQLGGILYIFPPGVIDFTNSMH